MSDAADRSAASPVARLPIARLRGVRLVYGKVRAVDGVSLDVPAGRVTGLIGPDGVGKSSLLSLMSGARALQEGTVEVLDGNMAQARHRRAVCPRIAYMPQGLGKNLYPTLSIAENLDFFGRLFGQGRAERRGRIADLTQSTGLAPFLDRPAGKLSGGMKQKLGLCCALIHDPDLLILDEPTTGVDPLSRRQFWELIDRIRADRPGMSVVVATAYMEEAARFDWLVAMDEGRVLATGSPREVLERTGTATLEEAFIGYLEEAVAERQGSDAAAPDDRRQVPPPAANPPGERVEGRFFNPRRMLSYSRLEALELRRDPIRATLALVGSLLLMVIMGYGINMDVEDLTFAVLDRDQTTVSRDYTLNLAGSRYFVERAPIIDYEDLDRRMRAGDLSLALEIPPGFGRDVARGRPIQIGAWIDGAMPTRAETVNGYVHGMHSQWLASRTSTPSLATIETRFRYNPDVESLKAIVPAVIPILLLLIPAMLTALSVVREKELGSIINLYVTPVTKLEFLLGKQLPYVGLAMLNVLLMTALAVTAFGVPLTGNVLALATGALLYSFSATAMGLLMSSFMRSQIAAVFGTAIATLIPATQYSGMIDPVSSLGGAAAVIGEVYPTTHFLTIARGVFSKALGFGDLHAAFVALLIAVPVLVGASALLLKKQET